MKLFFARLSSYLLSVLAGLFALPYQKGQACSYGPGDPAASVYSYAGKKLAEHKNMDWVVAGVSGTASPGEFGRALSRLKANPLVVAETIRSSYEQKAIGFVLREKNPGKLEQVFKDVSSVQAGLSVERLPDLDSSH